MYYNGWGVKRDYKVAINYGSGSTTAKSYGSCGSGSAALVSMSYFLSAAQGTCTTMGGAWNETTRWRRSTTTWPASQGTSSPSSISQRCTPPAPVITETVLISVADPWHLDVDPDPAILFIDLQDANKKLIKIFFFCILLFEGTVTSFFKDKKPKGRHKTVEIKVFLTMCLMIEGSGSRTP